MNIVLTGGPCSGKTTLKMQLQALGFSVVDEVAIQVIEEGIAKLGHEGFLCWKEKNLLIFQTRILQRQCETERRLQARLLHEDKADNTVIFDRGTLDAIAYLEYYQCEVPEALLQTALQSSYDLIVVCETLTDFKSRSLSGRSEDLYQSLALKKQLLNTYQAYGYRTIDLPVMPMSERLAYLLQQVKQVQGISLELY